MTMSDSERTPGDRALCTCEVHLPSRSVPFNARAPQRVSTTPTLIGTLTAADQPGARSNSNRKLLLYVLCLVLVSSRVALQETRLLSCRRRFGVRCDRTWPHRRAPSSTAAVHQSRRHGRSMAMAGARPVGVRSLFFV